MEEARTWSELLPAYEDRGLEVVMVSLDPNETEETVETFNERAGITEPLPTVIGNTEVPRAFGATALETTVILDASGEEVFRDVAVTDAGTIEGVLDGLL